GLTLDTVGKDLEPLFEAILRVVPEPKGDPNAPLQILVHNIQHDDYLGRLAVGRIHHGKVAMNQTVAVIQEERTITGRMGVLQAFEGPKRVRVPEVSAGDILSF